MLILDKIRKHVNKTPDALVMISGDEILTYSELWSRSARLAKEIEKRQNDNKSPVIVYGHKSPLMLISFIACARSGRAYCPVDVSMPKHRVADIAETIGNPLIIAIEEGHGLGVNSNIMQRDELTDIIEKSELKDVVTDRSTELGEEDTYYIIFTSGSTGKPKGAEISCGSSTKCVITII